MDVSVGFRLIDDASALLPRTSRARSTGISPVAAEKANPPDGFYWLE